MGYMASGKTIIGEILSKKLNYEFIDLDDFIVEKENKSVTDVFKSKGEIYFRKKEALFLKEIIENKSKLVLSLGGGTPCYGANLNLLQNTNNAKTIYLKASIPTIIERLNNQKGKRPLIAHIKSEKMLTEFIGKHLFERSQYYNQAQVIVATDSKPVKDIVEEIILNLF